MNPVLMLVKNKQTKKNPSNLQFSVSRNRSLFTSNKLGKSKTEKKNAFQIRKIHDQERFNN